MRGGQRYLAPSLLPFSTTGRHGLGTSGLPEGVREWNGAPESGRECSDAHQCLWGRRGSIPGDEGVGPGAPPAAPRRSPSVPARQAAPRALERPTGPHPQEGLEGGARWQGRCSGWAPLECPGAMCSCRAAPPGGDAREFRALAAQTCGRVRRAGPGQRDVSPRCPQGPRAAGPRQRHSFGTVPAPPRRPWEKEFRREEGNFGGYREPVLCRDDFPEGTHRRHPSSAHERHPRGDQKCGMMSWR